MIPPDWCGFRTYHVSTTLFFVVFSCFKCFNLFHCDKSQRETIIPCNSLSFQVNTQLPPRRLIHDKKLPTRRTADETMAVGPPAWKRPCLSHTHSSVIAASWHVLPLSRWILVTVIFFVLFIMLYWVWNPRDTEWVNIITMRSSLAELAVSE